MSQLRELSAIQSFIRELFHPEDEVLQAVQQEIADRGKPQMNIGPEQGRLLQVLLAAIGARRVLEVGTFFGYSAIWIARGLPPNGRLVCLEMLEEHAQTASRFLAEAGLDEQVEVRVGPALELLPALEAEPPFDLVFLDADKGNYQAYLSWIERLLRPGGILVVDNAYWRGRLLRDEEMEQDPSTAASYRGMHYVLDRLASDPRWTGTVMPYEDGLAVAVFQGQQADRRD